MLVVSEAMAASKRPRRSHLTSELNSSDLDYICYHAFLASNSHYLKNFVRLPITIH